MEQAEQNRPIIARLKQIVQDKEAHYTGCEIRVAAVRTESSGWGLVVGRLVFSDEGRTENSEWDYGWLRVCQRFFTVQDGLALIEAAALEGQLDVGDLHISLQGYLEDNRSYWGYQRPGYWPSDGSAFGLVWPTHMIQLEPRPAPRHSFPSGPIVTASLPLYPDYALLLKDRIGHEVQGTVFMHNLVVLVPNYIARISTVRPGISSLSVTVETHHKAREPTLVKAFADVGQPLHFQANIPSDGGVLRFDLPHRPNRWEVVLLESDGNFLDSRSSWMSSVRSQGVPLEVQSADDVLTLLEEHGGESDILEFKMMPRDNASKRDFAETVVAFANTRGEIILVGVDDNGRPAGAGPSGESDRLASIIRDRTDPPITPDVREVPLDPNPIYVITLSQSEQRPHQVWSQGTIYIRVGSTDRIARMEEIREMVRRETRGISPII